MTGPVSDAQTDVETLLQEYQTVFNDREYSRIPDVLTTDYVMHDPPIPEEGIPGPRGEAHGHDGIEQYIRMIETGFPHWEWSIDAVLVGEVELMYEGSVEMTHEGEWLGIPPTGRTAEFPEMGRVLIDDGKVSVHRIYFDSRDVAAQLGLR